MKMQMMIRFVWKSKHNGGLKHHCIVLRYMIFMGFVIANSYCGVLCRWAVDG